MATPAARPALPAQKIIEVQTSKLSSVKKGRLHAPLRYFFYGDGGVGKSTLAAASPEPIWIDAEDGSARLDVARYPFREGEGGHVPRTYAEVLGAIEDLMVSKHSYKTLVIDTVDKLEAMVWAHMIDRDNEPSARSRSKTDLLEGIESYGYGKGYTQAVDEWRALCVRLDRLRTTRGMSIILIAHSFVKNFKNPIGPDFDRFQPALNDKLSGFLKGWSDINGFVRHEIDAAVAPGGKRGERPRGFSTGRRLLELAPSAAFDAKSRIALPEQVEIDIANPWAPLAEAIEAGYENELPKLGEAIKAEIERIGDPDLGGKVTAAVTAALAKPDAPATLLRFLADLKNRPSKTSEREVEHAS